jgi:hypothetical protein
MKRMRKKGKEGGRREGEGNGRSGRRLWGRKMKNTGRCLYHSKRILRAFRLLFPHLFAAATVQAVR